MENTLVLADCMGRSIADEADDEAALLHTDPQRHETAGNKEGS
jgi:hypothetical protein